MKPIMNKPSAFGLFSGLAVSFILLAFTPDFGGEVYEVYLNDKLIIQQATHRGYEVPKLLLDKNGNDKLSVNYYNCGHIDTERSITARNSKNEILKEWKFNNASGHDGKAMQFSVKDLLVISDQGSMSLHLVYSSKETEKRSLASVVFNKETKIAR